MHLQTGPPKFKGRNYGLQLSMEDYQYHMVTIVYGMKYILKIQTQIILDYPDYYPANKLQPHE